MAKDAEPLVYYRDIKSKLGTMDAIMFRGNEPVSDIIAKVERASTHNVHAGDYTHIGLVMRPHLLENSVYIMESTMSGNLADGVPDIHGQAHFGVQIRDLDLVVERCGSRLAWLPLQNERRSGWTKPAVWEAYSKYKNTSYDASPLDLAASAVPLLRPVRDCGVLQKARDICCSLMCCSCCCRDQKPESEWLFCSEFAAHMYIDLGIIPRSVNPKNVIPCDFMPCPDNKVTGTMDADREVPWIFKSVVEFHK